MTCSDDHLGEYLAYGWEGGEHGYDFDADERGRAEFAKTLDRVLAGGAMPPDWLTPSGERGAAAIGGILHNKKRVLESGIVPNRGVIPNLPADAAVEVPVMADAAGIHPISLGPLPDADRQAPPHASERAAARGRGCDARLQGDRLAGAADRSGGEFRDRLRSSCSTNCGK